MPQLMRRFCLLTGLLLLALGAAACAQAHPAASGPGSNITVGGGFSAVQSDYGKDKLGGGFAYVDVHPQWRFGLEGEARYLRYHTNQGVHETTYLGGAHVYLRPENFRPYVKVLARVGRLDFPFGYGTGTYLVIAPGAGFDLQVSDRIAIRAIDFEYQDWPQFTYGALNPYGISMGISFRVNGLHRYPRH